jgi:hypothetical protein
VGLLRRRQEGLSDDPRASRHRPEDRARTLSDFERRRRRREKIGAGIRYAILCAVGLVMLYPLIWLIGASFKTNQEMFSSAWFWPSNPTVQGYIDGWETSTPYTFGRFFLELHVHRDPQGDRHGDLLDAGGLRLRAVRLSPARRSSSPS